MNSSDKIQQAPVEKLFQAIGMLFVQSQMQIERIQQLEIELEKMKGGKS